MHSTTGSDQIFRNTRAFRAAFVRGLGDMLTSHELGVFILVLANASYDPEIQALLQGKLHKRFDELAKRLREDLRNGRPFVRAPDDLLVFLKLMAIGYDELRAMEFRKAGPWEIQFNHLRAFRPPRMSSAVIDDLIKPFDANDFHFNKPFLAKEVFWEGELCGCQARLLYNKFPFAELHGLLVVEPQANNPQYLTPAMHSYMWQVTATLGEQMPGVGYGYNAYGAYASVNHLHFQMYLRDASYGQGGHYPVEASIWAHNGGSQNYPIQVLKFDQEDAALEAIEALHARHRSYNLLYRPGHVYLMPRALQGSYAHSDWTSGFAWAEMCGAFTTFNRDDFSAMSDERIRAEFALLAIEA